MICDMTLEGDLSNLQDNIEQIIWKSELAIDSALILIRKFASNYNLEVRYEEGYLIEIHTDGNPIDITFPEDEEEYEDDFVLSLYETLFKVDKLQAFYSLIKTLYELETRGFTQKDDVLFLNSKKIVS